MVTLPDMVPLDQYVVNLDLPPRQRWKHIYTIPKYKQAFTNFIGWVKNLSGGNLTAAAELGNFLLTYFPHEYAEEIRGGAEALQVDAGIVALANLGYELSDGWTSIVAQDADGSVLHARNLDFGNGLFFTDALRNMTFQAHFQRRGETLYTATMYVSYVGFLSAMKPGGFSVTVDTRTEPGGIAALLYEAVRAVTEKNYQLVSFLVRDTIATAHTWSDAVESLSNTPLIVDVYFITAGVSAGQGAVISRNETGTRNTWKLAAPSRWYEVETNYDHWKPAPWLDDRRYYANQGMERMNQTNVSLDGMLSVLSTKPVLNRLTTYSILMNPSDGTYKAWSRFCDSPCAA